MKTVREFKNFVLRVCRVRDHREFCGLSDTHEAFWLKLNALGSNGVPANAGDIDAAATLTDLDRTELLAEFHKLKRMNGAASPSIRTTTLLSRRS